MLYPLVTGSLYLTMETFFSRLLSVRISMLEITGEGAREIDSGVTQI